MPRDDLPVVDGLVRRLSIYGHARFRSLNFYFFEFATSLVSKDTPEVTVMHRSTRIIDRSHILRSQVSNLGRIQILLHTGLRPRRSTASN